MNQFTTGRAHWTRYMRCGELIFLSDWTQSSSLHLDQFSSKPMWIKSLPQMMWKWNSSWMTWMLTSQFTQCITPHSTLRKKCTLDSKPYCNMVNLDSLVGTVHRQPGSDICWNSLDEWKCYRTHFLWCLTMFGISLFPTCGLSLLKYKYTMGHPWLPTSTQKKLVSHVFLPVMP